MARLRGAKELRKALRSLPENLRAGAADSIRKSTEAMHARALENLDSMGVKKRTGVLRRNYRMRVNPAKLRGEVGLLTPGARKRAFYARFIDAGTSKMPARPFHTAAFEVEEVLYPGDQAAMLQRVLRRL